MSITIQAFGLGVIIGLRFTEAQDLMGSHGVTPRHTARAVGNTR